jgi:hypothetical protein
MSRSDDLFRPGSGFAEFPGSRFLFFRIGLIFLFFHGLVWSLIVTRSPQLPEYAGSAGRG